jgi:site-specific DNA-cytosine methylase
LSDLLNRLTENEDLAVSLGLDTRVISDLAKAADGSLALRLLLETLPTQPGELGHHLLTENYLSKRDGNHGDWLARLNADRPTKTMTSHMGKDTYSYVHPFEARTLSVREAARAQSFPDWFSFGSVSLVDGFRVIGNAVPPLLSNQIAERIFAALVAATAQPPASLEDSA